MKLAFSTLGCPAWDLDRVAAAAVEYGYEALEIRALCGSLDLLARPEFQPDRTAQTLALLAERGLTICCLDTSCRFDAADWAVRTEQEEIALAHAALASRLGAPLIRVFPDRIPAGENREATRDRIAASLASVARRVPDGVRIGLETHGDFAAASAAAEIVQLADHASVRIIWDAANSTAAGDTPAQAAAALAPWLAHVHLRDARPQAGAILWQPVLAGCGSVSFDGVFAALASLRYGGHVCFEWEKYWHPDLEEPEIALPDFAAAAQTQLRRVSRSGAADAW
jgi:sugar phosphate isomerase/epimerase